MVQVISLTDRKCTPPESADGTLLQFSLPAIREAVPEARHRVLEACAITGLSEWECASLDLALGEALANAVVHGNPTDLPNEACPICVTLWNYDRKIIVHINNRGSSFRPPEPPYEMPIANEQETHGRGLPLMEMLTEALVFCENDVNEGGTSIYLIKSL